MHTYILEVCYDTHTHTPSTVAIIIVIHFLYYLLSLGSMMRWWLHGWWLTPHVHTNSSYTVVVHLELRSISKKTKNKNTFSILVMSKLKPGKWNKYITWKLKKKYAFVAWRDTSITSLENIYFFIEKNGKKIAIFKKVYTHYVSLELGLWLNVLFFLLSIYTECRFHKLKIKYMISSFAVKGRGFASFGSWSMLLRSKVVGKMDTEDYINV